MHIVLCYFCSHLRSFDQSDHNYNYLFIFRNVIEGKKFDEELTVSHEFFKKLEKTARQITRKFKACFIRTNQEQLRKHISNKYFNCIEQILNIIVNYGKVNPFIVNRRNINEGVNKISQVILKDFYRKVWSTKILHNQIDAIIVDRNLMQFTPESRNHNNEFDITKIFSENIVKSWSEEFVDNCTDISLETLKTLYRTNVNNKKKMEECYCKFPSQHSIVITEEDYRCLEDRKEINDQIINFFLTYLVLEKFNKRSVKLFDTHFYEALSKSKESFERVLKYRNKEDIFEKDFFIVPVHKNLGRDVNHWFLTIIFFPVNIRNYKQTEEPTDYNEDRIKEKIQKREPFILTFDSLRLTNTDHHKHLRHFLSCKLNVSCAHIPSWFAEVKEQEDNYSCGIYLMYYCQIFLENQQPPYIFEDSKFKEKRAEIAEVIRRLSKKQERKVDFPQINFDLSKKTGRNRLKK